MLLEMYILPVLGSGANADNGMAHLVTFIHSFIKCLSAWASNCLLVPLVAAAANRLAALVGNLGLA
jgi:hypothetical protein